MQLLPSAPRSCLSWIQKIGSAHERRSLLAWSDIRLVAKGLSLKLKMLLHLSLGSILKWELDQRVIQYSSMQDFRSPKLLAAFIEFCFEANSTFGITHKS